MQRTAIILLIITAVLLMAYPFWGLLHPQTYVLNLAAHFPYADGVGDHQVRRSAALVWAPNGILASCLVCLAGFVANPTRTLHARWAGACLIVYPFVRTTVDAYIGLNLTAHTAEPEFVFVVGPEKLFFLLVGVILLGLASALSTQETARPERAHPETTYLHAPDSQATYSEPVHPDTAAR